MFRDMSGIPVFSFLIGIHVALLLFVDVDTELVREPVDVFTVQNTTVSMSCYTNISRTVSWEVERTGGGIDFENFYKGVNGDIPDIYQPKYNVSVDPTRNQYNLTIKNVQPEDSGTYRCGDNMGLSLWAYKDGIPHNGATAELVVIGNDLKCWQERTVLNFLHPETKTNHSSSVLYIKCNISYIGKIVPNVRWSLLKNENDPNGTSLQPYSHSFSVAEGAKFLLSSELVVNTLKEMHNSYVKFEVLDLYEESPSSPESVACSKIYWTSHKIEIDNTEEPGENRSTYGVGLVIGIVLMTALFSTIAAFVSYRVYKSCHRPPPAPSTTIGRVSSRGNIEEGQGLINGPTAIDGDDRNHVGTPFIPNTPTIEAQDSYKSVCGVTVVGEEIFVVRDKQSQVNVYDSHSLRASRRDINIPDMTRPVGLAGSAYNKALYISDEMLKCIHKVDLTNNSVTRWEMRENHEPHGLSVTAEHTLLVTVQISDTYGESGVVEYTSECQQVREIRFDRSFERALHTVQLSSDQFIVSHGWDDYSSLVSSLNRVCVINAEGQIIKFFGREGGRGEDQLYAPESLAIDEKSKHVFVADTWNHRVLMLDSELMTRLGDVHVSRDLRYPWRLYFDSSTDRLFVGELSGRLFVVTRPELKN